MSEVKLSMAAKEGEPTPGRSSKTPVGGRSITDALLGLLPVSRPPALPDSCLARNQGGLCWYNMPL